MWQILVQPLREFRFYFFHEDSPQPKWALQSTLKALLTLCGLVFHHCCCWGSKLCQTLLPPMDCSPPGSSVHGILQPKVPEEFSSQGCHFLLQGIFPDSGIKLVSPALAGDSLPLSYLGSPVSPLVPYNSFSGIPQCSELCLAQIGCQ